MKMPAPLAARLREKLAKNIGYWAHEYEQAVERIEDFTSDNENPYWNSVAESADVVPGEGFLRDEFGGEESPAAARARAFELLVLADLAEFGAEGERA